MSQPVPGDGAIAPGAEAGRRLRVGVLAIQGDFAAHCAMLVRMGCEASEVRDPAALGDLDGLVIPGGESTTLLKLITAFHFREALAAMPGRRRPLFGTCAGLILLAERVSHPTQDSLGLLPVDVRRNAYGRQVDSFVTPGEVCVPDDLALPPGVPFTERGPVLRRSGERTWEGGEAAPGGASRDERACGAGTWRAARGRVLPSEFVFIRAPRISAMRDGVEVLARCGDAPVLVRLGWVLAASYHPELSTDGVAEGIFVGLCARARRSRGDRE